MIRGNHSIVREEPPVNRTDLIQAIADDISLSVEDVEKTLSSMADHITLALTRGEAVALRNFGKFEPRDRAPVTRHNPATGGTVDVPASVTVGFIPSKNLKKFLTEFKYGQVGQADAAR